MMIKNFSNKFKIDLDICRIFNLYGQNDNFSIISKLRLLSKNNNEKLKVFNNGQSVRDFIHVNDVAKIYKKLLLTKGSDIIDIGTGKGLKIIEIIKNLKIPKKKSFFKKNTMYEIHESIADKKRLIEKINFTKFRSVENFLRIKKN